MDIYLVFLFYYFIFYWFHDIVFRLWMECFRSYLSIHGHIIYLYRYWFDGCSFSASLFVRSFVIVLPFSFLFLGQYKWFLLKTFGGTFLLWSLVEGPASDSIKGLQRIHRNLLYLFVWGYWLFLRIVFQQQYVFNKFRFCLVGYLSLWEFNSQLAFVRLFFIWKEFIVIG